MITYSVTVRPEFRSAFLDWQGKLNICIAGFPGFASLEFLISSNKNNQWVITQRFINLECVYAWRKSTVNLQLMEELKKLTLPEGIQELTNEETAMQTGVTEVFVTQITPDKEEAFRAWSAKIHQLEAKFPGFQGTYIQSPQKGGKNWITFLQFDTPENLERWLVSNERREILNESSSLIKSLESHRVMSPYAGWFSSIAKNQEIPSVWKQSMLVLLVLFPIVMLELKYLSPLTAGLNFSLGTFIGNAISVTLIAFPMMPIAIWLLGWWLAPSTANHPKKQVLGTSLILLLYIAEIVAFWNFF